MSLTLDEIAALQALGCDAYRQRVVGLFLSHRATPAHYAAMAEAVLCCSESGEGYLGREVAFHIAINRRFHQARQLGGAGHVPLPDFFPRLS